MRCGLVDVPGWFSVVTLPCSQITHCFLVGAFGVASNLANTLARRRKSSKKAPPRAHCLSNPEPFHWFAHNAQHGDCVMLSLSLLAAATERVSGSVPSAVAIRRFGAPARLEEKLRKWNDSTAEDLALLLTTGTASGISITHRRRLIDCSRGAALCDGAADDGIETEAKAGEGMRQHLEGRRLWHSTRFSCSDLRPPGKCSGKKAAGECASNLWGCDRTCGKCDPKKSELDEVDDQMPASSDPMCKDEKPRDKCRVLRNDGRCETWGCDRTCGKCADVRKMLASAEMKMISQRSRKSEWWVKYMRETGGYATAVVATLCKRVDRLALLVGELSSMNCIGEVMIVSRDPCVVRVQEMLEKNAAVIKARSRVGVKTTAVDMGGWDQIYGPAARFVAASRARESVLIHLDDDEVPCEKQVCRLALHALMEPIGLYGHHKRVCTDRGYTTPGNPMNTNHWHATHFNVLLTLFASTSRFVNDAFLRKFDGYAEPLASTRGNGEDLAYNHFLLRHFNRTPTYVRKATCEELYINGSDVYEGGFSKLNDEVGISAGVHHYRLRRRICKHLWKLPDWGTIGKVGPIDPDRLTPGEEEEDEVSERSQRKGSLNAQATRQELDALLLWSSIRKEGTTSSSAKNRKPSMDQQREGRARDRVTKTKTAGSKTPGEEEGEMSEDLEYRYAVRAEDLVQDARSRARVY